MRRTVLAGLLCIFALPLAAQSDRLSDKARAELAAVAAAVAARDPGPVPEILVLATIAASQSDHLERDPSESRLTRQLARMHLGAMPTLQRKDHETALANLLGERLEARRIAEIYAATVYYGRNCHGYSDAVRGLARLTPDRAGEAVWLALAALPRSPTLYLGNRVALKDRVALIVAAMEDAGLVGAAEAERLDALPLAHVDAGIGCSSR